MKRSVLYITVICTAIFFNACASSKPHQEMVKEKRPEIIKEKEVTLSPEEQQKESFEVFNQILEVSREGDRLSQVNKMTELYGTIINDYPAAPLAQESYLRLIGLYLRDYDPAKKDEAMSLYRYYSNKYPQSPLKNAIEETISRFFYNKKEWKELRTFVTPHIKEFIDTGELKTPIHMFYFSEAHFNLKNYKEAYKGYKIIIKKFPKSRNAKIANEKIETIKKIVEEHKKKEN